MYRCQSCKKVVGPGTPANFVVTAIRERRYYERRKPRGRRRRGREAAEPVPVGDGWERVQELRVCNDCNKKLEGNPKVVARMEDISDAHGDYDAEDSADTAPDHAAETNDAGRNDDDGKDG